jgi:putative tryptophan/tyrosine transport system substrate-binding protein
VAQKVRRIDRLVFFALVLLVAMLLVACSGASSGEPEMITVGVIISNEAATPNVEGFKAGMAELGYIEGENVTYIYNGPITDEDEQKEYTQSLVDQGVDLIFTSGTRATTTAKTTTSTIPVVFAPVAFPVEAGLVESISQPGGNITGVSNGASHGRRLQTMTEIVPDVKRIYIPIDPGETVTQNVMVDVQAAADELGLELFLVEFEDIDQMNEGIANFPDDVDAIFLVPGTTLQDTLPQWVELAIERKLPLSSDGSPDAGALFTLDADDYQNGFQAARLAVDILKGANPGDLPVEISEFFLTLNLKTADAIDLTISDDILDIADTVIR